MSFGKCSDHQRDAKGSRFCPTCRRIRLEGEIAAEVAEKLIEAGYYVSVFDCEEFTLIDSRDVNKIVEAMFTTDDDRLYVRKVKGQRDPETKRRVFDGWIWFVYGNSGWDVICDYTTNLEEVIGYITDAAEPA
jgi:hypothetical protein